MASGVDSTVPGEIGHEVPGGRVQVEPPVQVVLLDVREQVDQSVVVQDDRVGRVRRDDCPLGVPQALPAGREHAHRIVVIMAGKAELLEVVRAAHPIGGLPDLLNGRE
jgi:hypothetical protein